MTFSADTILEQAKSSCLFQPRKIIPLKDDTLWTIEQGLVRTCTLLEDGNIINLGLWGVGGKVAKALVGVNPYFVECLTPVRAQAFSLPKSQSLAEITFFHLQQLQELTIIRSHRKIDIMLLNLLSWLAQKFGQEVQTGQLIQLRLSHQDLADFLATTRVTVTRSLKQLEEQGFIERLPWQQIILKEESYWHYEI
jgi:CRP-like cAMP-binding protein